MEEHGMFIETTVEEKNRAEHEKYIRLAIKVRCDKYQILFKE